MTFPLGSLRSDSGAPAPPATAGFSGLYTRSNASAPSTRSSNAPAWRSQAGLLIGGVLWLLALLALVTHNAGDAAFSTSGHSAVVLNKAGSLGAWFSDLAYFVFGYSGWWLMAAALRAWLSALAGLLRPAQAEPVDAHRAPAWFFWLGLALLVCASASLEWRSEERRVGKEC